MTSTIDTLQEFMGYSLTQSTKLQKMLMIVGPKRAGKGVIGRVWRGLRGFCPEEPEGRGSIDQGQQ